MSGIIGKNANRSSGVIGTAAGGIASLAADSSPQLGGFLDAAGNYIQMEKGGDIASASPTVIDTDGDYFLVTGTSNFSAFSVAADRHFFLEFASALTMTHGNGTLDLPSGGNITTAASDVGEFVSTAANVVTCVNYTKRDGTAVAAAAGGKILQIQSSFDGASGVTTTRNVWYEVGTAVTLTPASTSSTILLFAKANAHITGGTGYALVYFSIQRTVGGVATDQVSTKTNFERDARTAGTLFNQDSATTITLGKDSPATTSELTYQAQYYTNAVTWAAAGGVYNIDLIAMEVGA